MGQRFGLLAHPRPTKQPGGRGLRDVTTTMGGAMLQNLSIPLPVAVSEEAERVKEAERGESFPRGTASPDHPRPPSHSSPVRLMDGSEYHSSALV